MHPARIAELLRPFLGEPSANHQRLAANDALYEHISTYIDILLRWNARINLTAIRDPEEIVTRHFGESLFAARHLFPTTAHVGTAPQACPERSRRGCPAERSSAPAVASRGSVPADTHAPSETNDQRPATNGRTTLADLGSGAGFPGLPIKLWAPRISLNFRRSHPPRRRTLRSHPPHRRQPGSPHRPPRPPHRHQPASPHRLPAHVHLGVRPGSTPLQFAHPSDRHPPAIAQPLIRSL